MASVSRTPYAAPSAAYDVEKGASISAFADAQIRVGFVRKVFGLLAVQLALTVVIGTIMHSTTAMRAFTMAYSSAVVLTSLGLSLGPLLYLTISEKARHQHPKNLILLATFTVGEGLLIGLATMQYKTDVVLLAMGMTAAITTGLTLYALTTKTDFTGMGPVMYAGLMALIMAGFVGFFIRTSMFNLVISTAGAAFFSMYLVYDIQLLMGGHHQCRVSPDEYVLATISIYLDIINLFLYILRALNSREN